MNDAILKELTVLVFGMTVQQIAQEVTRMVNDEVTEEENENAKERTMQERE